MKKIKIFISMAFIASLQLNAYGIPSKSIDDLAHAFMEKNQVQGMSIAFIKDDETHFFNYGFANEIQKVPTTNETIYTIASFTKTVTATLSAIAAVEQKVDLDEPFNRYIPELKAASNLNQITPRTLLGHVSSFPFNFEPRPKTYEAAIENLTHFQASRLPGSEYSYSNIGIGVMGYVLENIYGQDYQTILQEKLLTPLKMNSTYLQVPTAKEKYLSVGHDQNNQLVTMDNITDVWFAAASLKSTIGDMAKYLNAHMTNGALSGSNLSKAIPLVHENTYCFADKISCEQLAWQAHVMSELKKVESDTNFLKFDKNGNPIFSSKKIVENKDFGKNKVFIDKTGSGYGMSGYMAYIPEEKVGVVILLNKWVGDDKVKLGREILSVSETA